MNSSSEISALEIIKGHEIKSGYTLKSWYDNNSVAVCHKGKEYRMQIFTIIELMQNFEFKTSKKKVHTYLEINK